MVTGIERRQLITALGGAAVAWPLAARAQQAGRTPRIGVFMTTNGDDPDTKARLAAFRQELERFGWSDGRNVRIDYRFGLGRADQYPSFAKAMVALQPDVIVVQSTLAAAAWQQETRTIPIVFVGVSDPIGAGFVASLAQPGGNLTGTLLYEEGIIGKWLALLKEIAPRLTRIALIGNPKTNPFDYFRLAAEAVAPSVAVEIVPTPVEDTALAIEHAVENFAPAPNGGLLVLPDVTTITFRDLIIALAARHLLPAVYPYRLFVEAGGLLSYGVDPIDAFRLPASYVDRILRGAKPADLPVQAPTRYETLVNLKAANALGLEVPASLLVRADEVIE